MERRTREIADLLGRRQCTQCFKRTGYAWLHGMTACACALTPVRANTVNHRFVNGEENAAHGRQR